MLKMWEKIGGEEVIAQLVERDQIPNFLKEATVGPGEAVIYIRNGKIEDVITQDHIKVGGGGIENWFRSKMGGGEQVQLLFVSTAHVDLQIGIEDGNGQPLLTKDHEELSGTATIRVQISQNNAVKVINLMRESKDIIAQTQEAKTSWISRNILGKTFQAKPAMVAGKFLFKSDLEEKLQNEIMAMVFSPHITQVDA